MVKTASANFRPHARPTFLPVPEQLRVTANIVILIRCRNGKKILRVRPCWPVEMRKSVENTLVANFVIGAKDVPVSIRYLGFLNLWRSFQMLQLGCRRI